jgi:hypothetical protein
MLFNGSLRKSKRYKKKWIDKALILMNEYFQHKTKHNGKI